MVYRCWKCLCFAASDFWCHLRAGECAWGCCIVPLTTVQPSTVQECVIRQKRKEEPPQFYRLLNQKTLSCAVSCVLPCCMEFVSEWVDCGRGRFFLLNLLVCLFIYTTTHCSLKAYCAILARRSQLSTPGVSTRVTTREHPAAEGGTVGEKCPVILPKCRITRYI